MVKKIRRSFNPRWFYVLVFKKLDGSDSISLVLSKSVIGIFFGFYIDKNIKTPIVWDSKLHKLQCCDYLPKEMATLYSQYCHSNIKLCNDRGVESIT